MKAKRTSIAANPFMQGLALTLLVAGMSGCSSVGFKTGDKTAASLHRASQSIQEETLALESTINSLADLVSRPEADLKPQFKEFSASLDHLVESVTRADKSINRMQKSMADYLQAWDAELAAMNYEVIRQSSEARRQSVSNQIAAVCQRYEETQAVVRPFISYFSDIQRSLGTDLTADGLAATREVVKKAEANTRKVQGALEQLRVEFSQSSSRLSSVIAANEPLAASGQVKSPPAAQREAGLH